MRSDSILYTGQSSASTRNPAVIKERVRLEKEQKTQLKRDLTPSGEILRIEIAKEIAQLQNIDYLNIEELMTDEHFKAELMARKKTIEKLKAISSRIENILREH